jgi:hypothetical protein
MAKELNLRGRHNGEDKRQTQPKVDGRPASVSEIDALYKKDRVADNLNTAGGDGLVSKELHSYEIRMQQPQALGDHDINGRLPSYDNDVAPRRRGGRQGSERATFDHGKYDLGDKPGRCAKGGGKCEATGQDISESPFSAAHLTDERGRK